MNIDLLLTIETRQHTMVNRKMLSFASLSLLTLLLSCSFAYDKQIVGNYHIVGVDTDTDLGLCYKLDSGDCVGKAPGVVLAYGFNEKFLVAKTKEDKNSEPKFYIIDMTKDSELAIEENFRIGPISETEYFTNWSSKLKIGLTHVER